MEKTQKQENKQSKKVKFIVVREFLGDKTMQEAFEQLIERQTCEHFEEWLERKASWGNWLKKKQGHDIIYISCPCS